MAMASSKQEPVSSLGSLRSWSSGLLVVFLSALGVMLASQDAQAQQAQQAQYLNNCQCLYNGVQAALANQPIRPIKTNCRDISYGGDSSPHHSGYMQARDPAALAGSIKYYKCNPKDFGLSAAGPTGSKSSGSHPSLSSKPLPGQFGAWSVQVLPTNRTCPIGTMDQARPGRNDKYCIQPCHAGYLGYNFGKGANLLCVRCPAGTQSVRFESSGAQLSCLQDLSGTHRWPQGGWRPPGR